MAYEQKETDIAIFLEKERKTDKAPHWRGTALVNGVKMEVALWEKGTGGTMLAGAIKPARDVDTFRSGGSAGAGSGGSQSMAGSQGGFTADLDSEIPF